MLPNFQRNKGWHSDNMWVQVGSTEGIDAHQFQLNLPTSI